MSQGVNETICVDHFHLDDVRLFHVIDTMTRFSAPFFVPDAPMNHAVMAFESCWLNQFWTPSSIREDKAFMDGFYGWLLWLVALRRSAKDVM